MAVSIHSGVQPKSLEWIKYGSIISFRNPIEILSIGIQNMEKHKHQLGEIRTNAKISNILYKCVEVHNGAGDTSKYHHDSYPGSDPGILQSGQLVCDVSKDADHTVPFVSEV